MTGGITSKRNKYAQVERMVKGPQIQQTVRLLGVSLDQIKEACVNPFSLVSRKRAFFLKGAGIAKGFTPP